MSDGVTENQELRVEGLDYRFARLGAELVAGKVVAFRLGAYQNLAVDDSEPVFTGGLGFRIFRFEVALAAAISSADQEIESDVVGETETIPSGAAFSISLGWNHTF